MPKQRRRREHQHLNQESSRKRQYTGGAPMAAYKPGFPMNIFANVKLFAVIGVVVAALMIAGLVLTADNSPASVEDTFPTPTPTTTPDPNATGTPTATATQQMQWSQPEQVIEAGKTYTAILKTSKGDITIQLDPESAPNTVNSFVFLAQQGYFNGITFHRVASGFVIQSGDRTGTGRGGPGYQVQDEPSQNRNTRYTVSMAKAPGATSFGSQFFINLRDNPALDYDNPTPNKFYPFGQVIAGQDVVDAIGQVPTNPPRDGKPVEDVVINEVIIEVG